MDGHKGKLRWGIVGLGNIAHSFVQDLVNLDSMILEAVASRSQDKADNFKEKYKAKTAYGSYEQLFDDKDVDIVYIATPHDSHMEWSIAAMTRGKHVLCEKPIGVNVSQFEKMISASKKHGVFLMEAFWTKFNPSIKKVFELVQEGAIGPVNYVNADFSFYRDDSPESRLFNMDLAGGALLDVGVYPIFLAYNIFGMPTEILASAHFNNTGADVQTLAILKYDNGFANIMCGLKSKTDMKAKIYGEQGAITIDSRWHETEGFEVQKGEEIKKYAYPTRGTGYTYEIEECLKCISSGQIESDNWSLNDSLNILKITDEIRSQIGLKYPFE